ncbi:hypothetical protein OBP_213 [Pseudomonas phage OBP]|uniref:hypothetical protein n=1 Tax=Pseudomonas phage OBP TaxID=1124849 RepID=UPI000240D5B9|nr:hypothetical protein OBP_213 [Pseudomonas phage OBP]AEV89650.1 hypothetical protein OBP_213 [Pseudomonas phage OBP]
MTNFILNVLWIIFLAVISIVNLFHKAVVAVGVAIVNTFFWIGDHFIELFAGFLVVSVGYLVLNPPVVIEEEEVEEPVDLVLVINF